MNWSKRKHAYLQLSANETSRKAAEIKTREAVDTRNMQMESVENVNSEINSMQVQLVKQGTVLKKQNLGRKNWLRENELEQGKCEGNRVSQGTWRNRVK